MVVVERKHGGALCIRFVPVPVALLVTSVFPIAKALGNTDVTHAALLLACSFPATHACGRVVDLESCITVWFLINNASMCEVMMQLQVCVHKRIIVQICCMRFDGFHEGQFSSAPWNMGGVRPRALHCFTNACHSFFCLFWLEPKYRKS
jgi:hypothetical protein